jgi:hypothetical protein
MSRAELSMLLTLKVGEAMVHVVEPSPALVGHV